MVTTRYEYRAEVIPVQPEQVNALLNQWAADGWRLHTALLVQARASALQGQTQPALELILERPATQGPAPPPCGMTGHAKDCYCDGAGGDR